jgi:threonine/homoserine/homoserine lactone efflux protein
LEFLTIALAHAIAVASPGPDFALVLKTSLAKGHRAGTIAALGIASGISLHMFYCIVGLELIQSYFQSYLIYASYLGAAVLIYLGLNSLYVCTYGQGPKMPKAEQNLKFRNIFFIGFLTNGMNVKATIFFISLFAIVIDIHTPIYVLILYGIYLVIATFIWFYFLSYFLTRDHFRDAFRRYERRINLALGIVFIFFGLQFLIQA